MPSRFLDDTLDRIDRAPQPRPVRLRSRLPVLNPTLRSVAAAALVLAVAGLGAAVLTRTADIGNAPLARPGPLPAALQGMWRPVGARAMPAAAYYVDISIDATTIRIASKDEVHSSALLVGRDRIELRATRLDDHWHCQVGDPGVYLFGLTAADQHLTLTPVGDACAERAAVLTGDWVPQDIGDLPAGRYVSPLFRPFGGGVSGRFGFTVPTGWADNDGHATSFILLHAESAPRDWDLGFDRSGIWLLSNAVPSSHAAGCTDLGAGVERTPAAMATWLRTLPGLVVTPPTPVSISGLSGVMVDLSVDPGWQSPCPDGPPGLPLDTFQGLAPEGQLLRLSGTGRARYILLDGGDGSAMVIDIQAPDEAAWGPLLAEAMPIVERFEFAR
jgi:hypothetical protein